MVTPQFSLRTYLLAYAGLMGLLLLNVLLGMIDMGWANMFVAVTIAVLQAAILVFVLMHGWAESALMRLMMAGALVWFLILVTLTMTDYITRNWVPIAGQ